MIAAPQEGEISRYLKRRAVTDPYVGLHKNPRNFLKHFNA